jgi:ArsR family transcriptional regulator
LSIYRLAWESTKGKPVAKPRETPRATCCAPTGAEAAQSAQRFAPLCKALGDGTRLGILGLLIASEEPLCACELEACFDLSQPTISHHLRLLREAGLVETERRGTWIHYSLAPAGAALASEFAAWLGRTASRT